jgi:hypothetical protein
MKKGEVACRLNWTRGPSNYNVLQTCILRHCLNWRRLKLWRYIQESLSCNPFVVINYLVELQLLEVKPQLPPKGSTCPICQPVSSNRGYNTRYHKPYFGPLPFLMKIWDHWDKLPLNVQNYESLKLVENIKSKLSLSLNVIIITF